MSWTKIFPSLDEAMLEKAREGRNEEDRAEFEQHFGVLASIAPTDKEIRYRPILGGHFGARGGLMPIRELIEAFLWHAKRGSLPKSAKIPRYGEVPIKFADWPDYGFDEWFQLAAMYPRFAHAGVLSFIPIEARSILLPLDLEYVTWANPKSEMLYF